MKRLLQGLIVGAGLVGALIYGAPLLAQSTTVIYNVLHGDVSQWGASSVTAATALSDAVGNPTSPLVGANALFWDTTQWVRGKAAALTTMTPASTLTARSIVGAQLVEKSSRWYALSNPAAGAQATASIAAEASVRHVADCVSFSAGSVVAPVLTALTVNLRDGATGAGTLIWTKEVIITAAAQQNVAPFALCGLNLVGTTNTAMTLEFSALLANLIEEASLTGFNVQ
jgi:hypothetical protein